MTGGLSLKLIDWIAIGLIAAVMVMFAEPSGDSAPYLTGYYVGTLIGTAAIYILIKRLVVRRKRP